MELMEVKKMFAPKDKIGADVSHKIMLVNNAFENFAIEIHGICGDKVPKHIFKMINSLKLELIYEIQENQEEIKDEKKSKPKKENSNKSKTEKVNEQETEQQQETEEGFF